MFDLIESALTTHTAGEPSSPLVVSVPHAGLGTAGFERALTPELDVRCDADLFVDQPVPHRRNGRARGLRRRARRRASSAT